MDRLLDDAMRMVLAWRGTRGPVIAPMAYWWDGRHVWLSTSASAGKVQALEARPACAMLVQRDPEDREEGDDLLLRGTARVFRPTDLLAMATHGPVVAAAQTALALKNATSIAGYVADAARIPRSWLPASRVVVRIAVESVTPIPRPEPGPGIAPALPTSVPPEVRRLVAGERQVVLGTLLDGAVGVLPAAWNAGYRVALPAGVAIPAGTRVSALVDHDPGFRPTEVAGVAVNGVWADGRIDADRVRWWHGFDGDVVDVVSGPADPIVIPD